MKMTSSGMEAVLEEGNSSDSGSVSSLTSRDNNMDAHTKRWIYSFDMSKVLPGLYVGNYRDSKDPQQLDRYNISHIIAIHDSPRRLLPDKHYLCVMAADTPDQNLSQYFSVCNDFIHAARLRDGNVLIHCLAGMSRSVTVAVAYIMSVTPLSWKEALKVVRAGRAVANPNLGFQTQLQDFELYKLPEERRRLKERFPSIALSNSDRDQCGLSLNNYEELLSNKDICEGNCVKGQDCPTGMCRTDPSKLFRRKTSSASIRSASRLAPSPKTSQSCPTSPRYNNAPRSHRGSRIDEIPGTSSLQSSPAEQRRGSNLRSSGINRIEENSPRHSPTRNNSCSSSTNNNNNTKAEVKKDRGKDTTTTTTTNTTNSTTITNTTVTATTTTTTTTTTNSKKDNGNSKSNVGTLQRSASAVGNIRGNYTSKPTGFKSYTGSAPPSVHGSRVDLSGGPTGICNVPTGGSAIYLGFNPAGRNSYVGSTFSISKDSTGGSAPPTPVNTPPVSPKRNSKRLTSKK